MGVGLKTIHMNATIIRDKAVQLLRNKYFLASFIFIVWIAFFDRNRLQVQCHLSDTISQLEEDKAHYDKEYTRMKDELKVLNSDLENYAREKYFIKKDNELVYIIDK